MIRVGVHGAAGRMGCAVIRAAAESEGVRIVAAFDRAGHDALDRDAGLNAGLGRALGVVIADAESADLGEVDVVIDFSLPASMEVLVDRCRAAGSALVTGTTGLNETQSAALQRLAEHVPVVAAPNFSVGVNVFWALCRRAAELLGPDFDLEVMEMHHRDKVDAPSGTAARLAQLVAEVRGNTSADVLIHGREGQVGPRSDREIGMHALRGGSVVGDHTLVCAGAGERVELTHRAQGREIFARGAVRAALWAQGRAAGAYSMADVLGIG